MCIVYNSVGCLTMVKSHLDRHNITEFKSIHEILTFQKSYETLRQQIISNSEFVIEREKCNILSENQQLTKAIEATCGSVEKELLADISYLKSRLEELLTLSSQNFWLKVTSYLRIINLKRKIRSSENSIPDKVSQSVNALMGTFQSNENRYAYITSRFQDAVIENCSAELSEIVRKKRLVDEVTNSIYGAIGEQKVVKELEALPDDYVLINDFCLTFNPPIYNRNDNDHIKSIQLDHLLVAPSGVYLIETKNWSEQSMNNLNLRSPVSQLKRTSFAVFCVLNRDSGVGLNQHPWGKRKVVIRNIVVLINHRPQEEFQYIKVLTLAELVRYIKYFPPIYTKQETQSIASELMHLMRR